jgi:hypothetical protein
MLFYTPNQEGPMNTMQVLRNIKAAINAAPRNSYVAELHLQIIKYADVLEDVSGKEFCDGIGVGPSFGTEFAKMRKIAPRLKKAGLDTAKI